MCNLHNSTCGKIYLTLQTSTLQIEWWQHIIKSTTIIGSIGPTSFGPILTHTFKTSAKKNKSMWSKLLLSRSGKENLAEDFKSEHHLFRMLFQPLARPSNWLASQTPCTKQVQPHTISESNDNWNPSGEKTHQHNHH